MNAELSMPSPSMRREPARQSWVRWFLDHTFHVRRQDGSTDKTEMAWRSAKTTFAGAVLSGMTYIIMQLSNGSVHQPSVEQRLSGIEQGVRELKQQTDRLEDRSLELTAKARRFDRFIDGFESGTPAKTK